LQCPLFDGHRVGINGCDFRRPELAIIGRSFRVNDHTVWKRSRSRRVHYLDVPGLGIEASDFVRTLHGEPQDPLLLEEGRMRITRMGGQFVFGELTRFGIELADVALRIRGEPNISIFVFNKTMRSGARYSWTKFFDVSGLSVDSSEHVRILSAVPEVTI